MLTDSPVKTWPMPNHVSLDHQVAAKRRLFSPLAEILANRKFVKWLIKDILPRAATCGFNGESGAGKTFSALDMALSIATGKSWHGRRTTQGAVFYVCGEGQAGLGPRCLAWGSKNNIIFTELTQFYATDGAVLLPDDRNLNELMVNLDGWIAQTGEKPALIIFDTLARCLMGNENQAEDASGYVQSIDKLRIKYGCCVLTVHHTGKDSARGGRGSSVFKAAWDIEILLTNLGSTKQLSITKSKDSEPPEDMYFSLESIATPWADDEGQTIYSAVMCEAGKPERAAQKIKLSAREEAILQTLHDAMREHGEHPNAEILAKYAGFAGGENRQKVVHIDHWRKLAYQVIDAENGAGKRVTFNRCKNKLLDAQKIIHHDGYLWLLYYD